MRLGDLAVAEGRQRGRDHRHRDGEHGAQDGDDRGARQREGPELPAGHAQGVEHGVVHRLARGLAGQPLADGEQHRDAGDNGKQRQREGLRADGLLHPGNTGMVVAESGRKAWELSEDGFGTGSKRAEILRAVLEDYLREVERRALGVGAGEGGGSEDLQPARRVSIREDLVLADGDPHDPEGDRGAFRRLERPVLTRERPEPREHLADVVAPRLRQRPVHDDLGGICGVGEAAGEQLLDGHRAKDPRVGGGQEPGGIVHPAGRVDSKNLHAWHPNGLSNLRQPRDSAVERLRDGSARCRGGRRTADPHHDVPPVALADEPRIRGLGSAGTDRRGENRAGTKPDQQSDDHQAPDPSPDLMPRESPHVVTPGHRVVAPRPFEQGHRRRAMAQAQLRPACWLARRLRRGTPGRCDSLSPEQRDEKRIN